MVCLILFQARLKEVGLTENRETMTVQGVTTLDSLLLIV